MKRITLFLFFVLILSSAAVSAQDKAEGQDEMMEMDAPDEMKEISHLAGTWDADMEFLDWNTNEWTESKGVATYSYILDSCVMEMDFKSTMMGMPYKGHGLQVYNRETDKWQMTWADNMSGFVSMYDGEMIGDTAVFVGEDRWQGQAYHSKISTWDIKEGKFGWRMENSMDGGKTWTTSGKAVYTKRK